MALKGLGIVLKNLAKAVKEIQVDATQGLLEAGALVRREGQIETPVDIGNLVNSWYGPHIEQTPKGPVAEIGLTSSYAIYVHENLEASFQKPGSKAKFLEDPVKRNEQNIIQIIASRTKRK